MKAIWKLGLGSLLLWNAAVPAGAWAADSGKQVHIELILGQDVLKVNNEAITVEKPYISNGSTLVPLRVITTAFGAVLTWDSETKTVGLKSGQTSLSLQIGSTTATVNGVQETLEAAPELQNGTTMVPLRFISEKFGAKVAYDDATKQITITGSAEASSGGSSIDTDLGKTQIGNSYYGWSMKYPTGLIKDYQSFQEDFVGFEDADGEFRMSVQAETGVTENMSEDALISRLSDETEGKVLKKTFVKQGQTPYALIVTQDDDGVFEHRAYQSGDRLYILIFYVEKEEDYKNPAKYSKYQNLLDSFQVKFNSSDSTVKDLSTVKNGYRTYTDETYGYSLKLPADWEKAENQDDEILFYDPKKSKFITMTISSKADKDSLQPWVDRVAKRFEDMFVADYRKMDAQRSTTVDGNPAVALRSKTTIDKKSWSAVENVFFIKGNYKYQIHFDFEKEADLSEMLIKDTLNSLKVTQPSSSIGDLKDAADADRSQTSLVRNKAYGFHVTVPAHWKQNSSAESNMLQFGTGVGKFSVFAYEDVGVTPQEMITHLKNAIKEEDEVEIKDIESKSETIAGVNAHWNVFEAGVTTSIVCVFEKDGTIYVAHGYQPNALYTETLKKQIKAAILSIQVP
ncbi:hypothetical protein J2T17_003609 [Paenibacillus mucilaginosus]|uniref:copper amine oxidase N-terminal domain-containing protein n=1 Tax=Paenibacillus mucilaginosus TaxID=61624 RepID=UPI003D1FB19A